MFVYQLICKSYIAPLFQSYRKLNQTLQLILLASRLTQIISLVLTQFCMRARISSHSLKPMKVDHSSSMCTMLTQMLVGKWPSHPILSGEGLEGENLSSLFPIISQLSENVGNLIMVRMLGWMICRLNVGYVAGFSFYSSFELICFCSFLWILLQRWLHKCSGTKESVSGHLISSFLELVEVPLQCYWYKYCYYYYWHYVCYNVIKILITMKVIKV